MLSYLFLFILLPLFIGVTAWGAVMMLVSWRKTDWCFKEHNFLFIFSLALLVFSCFVILAYVILLMYGINASQKAKDVRK